ncbi:4Fe-4S dicluster domain-containing protein [Chloroflexota bacterium]
MDLKPADNKERPWPKAEATSGIIPDFSLLHEVESACGEKVSLCYQCRKCTSGCPVTFAMDYPPDVLLRMVQLGLKDRVLRSDTIWICASCETCTTRCPNEIDIAGVIDALRHMALGIGESPEARVSPWVNDVLEFHRAFLGSIKRGGRIHELGMTMSYMLKTNPWPKLKSGELFSQALMGLQMFKRGKFGLLPHKLSRIKEIRKLFERDNK